MILIPAFQGFSLAQTNREPIYDPSANAQMQIETAVARAASENKFVFITIGGNWCSWCYLFHDFIDNNPDLKNYIEDNFVTIHINYSKENMNKKVLASLEYPQRFGFPVFVILDKSGKEIHIQDSSLLEEGHGYNKEKVFNFFRNWSPDATDKFKEQ